MYPIQSLIPLNYTEGSEGGEATMLQIILRDDILLERYMDGYMIELPHIGSNIVIEFKIYKVIEITHFLEQVHRIEVHVVEI